MPPVGAGKHTCTASCPSRACRAPPAPSRTLAGRIWTPRVKRKLAGSYYFGDELAFVASRLTFVGASTGRGRAQRAAKSGVTLTRAARGAACRDRAAAGSLGTATRCADCSRIFGPSAERSRLRATMENARGDANRCCGLQWLAPNSACPRAGLTGVPSLARQSS